MNMYRKITISLLIFIIGSAVSAQEKGIRGEIYTPENEPVEYATVVLQTPDSLYVDACVTDSLGVFSFAKELPFYRLIVQHVLYETKEIECQSKEAGVIYLSSKDLSLGEVVVTAERPLVKVVEGVLAYDVKQVTEGKTVSSAYDAVLALPGVREQNGNISLAGTDGVTLILNGKPTTMSSDQLLELLKQMPASYVETAEVMYSAPPQYHVRGAAINLVVGGMHAEADRPVWQGEVNGSYLHRNKANYATGLSLLYASQKLSADFLYSFADMRRQEKVDLFSRHSLDGALYSIEQHNNKRSQAQTHTGRLGLDYRPDKENLISLVYTTFVRSKGKTKEYSTGNFSQSLNFKTDKQQMHNLSFDYQSGFGLKAGANYTYFNSPSVQRFTDTDAEGIQMRFTSDARQRINRFMVYADQVHTLQKNWKVTYGTKFSYAADHDYQFYPDAGENASLYDTDNTIKEYIYDVYAGVGKDFSSRFSMNLSLMGEYYKLAGDDEWTFFPQAQFTYKHSTRHILQLAFSSDKQYANYWDKQDYIRYPDGYTEVHGNPSLKPYDNYTGQLSYICNQKYVFTFYYIYQPDYALQLAYQASDRLALIYQTQNWDYNQNIGLNVIVPFSVGNFWHSRLTFNGFYQQSKNSCFYDIGFNNEQWIGYAATDNTFNLSSRPDIKLELSGYYMTKPIQGIYDMSDIYNLDAGVKWTFAGRKAELRLKVMDILDSSTPDLHVRRSGQDLDMLIASDSRRLQLSFSYKFGGYQKKERKEVDKSRFGH